MFFYYLCFDNFIFAADFNVSTNLNSMIYFCDLSGLRILINIPICYENFENPTSTDLISINYPSYFQLSFLKVFKTEILKFLNTMITKPWITISLDLKYWCATLIELIWKLLEKLFLIYWINMYQLKIVCTCQWGILYDQRASQSNYETV